MDARRPEKRVKLRLILSIFVCAGWFFPLRPAAQGSFRVMFYNVENLFDCRHDSLKNDEEFLPSSIRAWHEGRYKHKLSQIGKVIVAAGRWEVPALVGLCEVENSRVMNDLTLHSPLKEQGYRYVMTDSPDRRGIDVALLYQRDRFRLLDYRSIPVRLTGRGAKPTRDILYVSGLVSTSDTLDIFVCHLPSRSGGANESQPFRKQAAAVLKQQADSLFRIREHPNLIFMGDFNDYPGNASLRQILQATEPGEEIEKTGLYNLMAGKKEGSYKYREEWGILDQLIVSGFMLQGTSGIHTSAEKASVFRPGFLLQEDERYGGMRPLPTYRGMKYTGGFSDHLPVVADFAIP